MALLSNLGFKKSAATVAGCGGNGTIMLMGLKAYFMVTLLCPATRRWVSGTQTLEIRACGCDNG